MMRILRASDYRRMPWRNGGGTTTEIAIMPEGAALSGERFLYRISIAEVASDGPFSRFEGYDRHIMLLEGDGMTIDCGAHGTIDLRTRLVPRSFSGDWDVAGELVGGAVRDFNVIVDRARASASLVAREVVGPETLAVGAGERCIVYVLSGALASARAGDTIVADAPLLLSPVGRAELAIARIYEIAGRPTEG